MAQVLVSIGVGPGHADQYFAFLYIVGHVTLLCKKERARESPRSD
jgi:hypothetical protein